MTRSRLTAAQAAVLVVLARVAVAQSAPAAPIPKTADAILAKELLAHATFLASDEMQGRDTGSPGQEATARYIATRFEQWGLEPMGDELPDGKRDWFQGFDIVRRTLDPKKTCVRAGQETIRDGLIFFPKDDEAEELEGKLVFCGTGRRGRGQAKNDFTGKELEGNIAVIVMRGKRAGGGMVFGGNPVRDRAQAAKQEGAKGCIVLAVGASKELEDAAQYFGIFPGKAIVSYPGADMMGGAMQTMGKMLATPIPTAVVATEAGVKVVLAALGLDADKSIDAIKADKLNDLGAGQPVAGAVSFAVTVEKKQARNVVACLRGKDEKLASEAVVFSAHMDHIGVRYDGDVYNGADDNASGTSGLLEIAHAHALARDQGERTRRTLLFLSVCGEEKGLWGSAHFASHPTWPVKQIVADVNTDMIGRSGEESGPDEVTVTPSHDHKMFSTLVRDAHAFARTLGMGFTDGDKYYERSDHYNFATKGIPVVFFCNGEHEDYHQVSDSADKLDGRKMERIARLAFTVGRHVANQDERPKVLGKSRDWAASEDEPRKEDRE